MASLIQKQRFHWGVNLDDMWVYAGFPPPKSIIIPYLLSVRLPRGPYRIGVDPASYTNSPEVNGDASSNVAGGSITREVSERLALELKENRLEFVRGWFQWNFFQPRIAKNASQTFQFPLDDFVSSLNERGIEIIAVIGNGYTRFLPEGIDLDNVEDYVNRLSESCRQIVRHYRGKIGAWQIENEPNWWLEHYSTHWRGGGIWIEKGIQELILSKLHDIVREEDSNSTILVNLEADHTNTDWKLYSKYCDVLGLDFYPNYSHSSPVDASKVKFASQIKEIVGQQVMIAETGYPSGPRILGYNEQNQAEYAKQVCEESYACDAINGISMWRLRDAYWHSFPDQENHFGLLGKEGTPKPAWFEYVKQIKQKR